MDQKKAERLLCGLYAISAALALTSCVSSGIVWDHWRLTLDQCVNQRNCSCILYGESTPTHFLGGSIHICSFISFGPIPIIIIFIGLGIYHGFRATSGPSTEATRSVMTKNESGEIIHMQIRTPEIEPINRIYWIIASTLSVVFGLYMLIHFSIFADGYLYSCKQYRRELIKLLNLTGTAVAVVHNRLTCNAVFDFMDYLQPVAHNIIRNSFINTPLALLIGIITSFFSFIALACSSIINIKFARIKL